MSRYHFHYVEPDGLVIDEEGQELPNLPAAVAEAESAGREILAEMVKQGEPLQHDWIEIADEDGTVLEKVALRSLLNLA